MEKENCKIESAIKTIVIVFFLVYGLHYFGYFLRARYYNFIGNLSLSEGINHVFQYLGHLVYLIVYIFYIWIVKDDRKYFLSAFKESAGKNIIKALLGALLGFCLMGICIFAAHAMWNFTQDFIFGLPDSGKPAAVSIFNTTVSSSSFFYDKDFGIEGSRRNRHEYQR